MGRVLLCALLAASTAEAAGWEEVARADGIVVHTRDVPGRDLAVFRGTGAVRASIYEVMAVLGDSGRRTEWQHRCAAARTLKRTSEFKRIVYNRTDAPWPVTDRDVVLATHLRVLEPDRVLLVEFRGVSSALQPKVSGVVRMPYLKGHYKLTKLASARTRVEYQVDADPGGWLPSWLANRANRDLPLKTLRGLRRQVRVTRGAYERFLDRWDPARRIPVEPGASASPAEAIP